MNVPVPRAFTIIHTDILQFVAETKNLPIT